MPYCATKLDLNLKEQTVLQYYIWSIALYDAGTWTLQKIYKKCLASSEILSWRRKEKIIIWIGLINNEVKVK